MTPFPSVRWIMEGIVLATLLLLSCGHIFKAPILRVDFH